MSPAPLPALFVSHGAPLLAVEDGAPRRFFQTLGAALGHPQAILAVSAHWEASRPTVSRVARPETIHDFHGFPAPLYQLRYPAPGAPALAERTAGLLARAGFDAGLDPDRGLDHGAWVPLMLMYPEADIPVAQLSLIHGGSAADHLALGRALAPLRAEGVLVLGSGSAVHNLRALDWSGGAPEPWARDFLGWLDATLTGAPPGEAAVATEQEAAVATKQEAAVAAWRDSAPSANRAHPTDDHFLPLAVALAAAGPEPHTTRLHASWAYGSLGMHAWAFSGANEPRPVDPTTVAAAVH